MEPPFDHCFFGDKDQQNINALKARISDSDRSRVTISLGDCNVLVDDVVRQLSPKPLGFAFVDPEGFEVDYLAQGNCFSSGQPIYVSAFDSTATRTRRR
ncbi:MAG: hypothetical protein ACREPW_12130 [Candidatus Binataceae bacterium]